MPTIVPTSTLNESFAKAEAYLWNVNHHLKSISENTSADNSEGLSRLYTVGVAIAVLLALMLLIFVFICCIVSSDEKVKANNSNNEPPQYENLYTENRQNLVLA